MESDDIEIDPDDGAFLDAYAAEHRLAGRSAAFRAAVQLLRDGERRRALIDSDELGEQYRQAFLEWEERGEARIWDRAVRDGLPPERWQR
jgi:hypothetical protein